MSRRRAGSAAAPDVDDRRGMVLLGAVVALVVVGLLAHGALLLARFEAAATRASLALLQARAAAEAGLTGVSYSGVAPPVGLDSVRVGESRPWAAAELPTGRYEVTLSRSGRETWLADARGWDASGRVSVGEMRALWRMDPWARTVDFPALAMLGPDAGVTGGGSLDSSSPRSAASPLTSTLCAPWLASTDPAPPATLPAVGRLSEGTIGVPALGLLGPEDFLEILPALVADQGTPEPVRSGGRCLEGEWNWGDPDDPGGPCGGRFVGARALGDLVVDGGRGQGLLIVPGNLVLTRGSRFHGVALVGGTLRLGQGVTMEGLVAAREGLEVDEGATLRVSLCSAARALHAAESLATFRVVPGGRRLGPLGGLP